MISKNNVVSKQDGVYTRGIAILSDLYIWRSSLRQIIRRQVNNTYPTSTAFLADIANQKTSLNLTKKKIGTSTSVSRTSLVTKKDRLAGKMHGSAGSTDL